MDSGEVSPEPGASPGPVIVGMGASAGGLEALATFFENVPPENGMAFVVVMHQHPTHTSLMPELLARHTSMPVAAVDHGTRVVAEHVYVAPPGFTLEIRGGHLQLVRPADGGQRAAIDHFFRSLAMDQKERAIGVILSGAGSDGTIGLREIKAASGMIMVQDEASAKYAGMPHSAIATTLVDYILPVESLPEQLVAYTHSPFFAAEAGRSQMRAPAALDSVVALLRNHTGNDFSCYKESTLRRRIERRMSTNRVGGPDDYVRLLERNPAELHALFQELLIGVTSFFRDPEAFAVLSGSLEELLHRRPAVEGLRAWVAGCATGEEAYSLAILARETSDRLGRPFTIQIFATDLDNDAIQAARTALFPESISEDVPADRLGRYFSKEERGYRVRKDIRDLIVFASHNLLKHPPFTKVDLIVCRNVLIYLNGEAQASILPLFHYALRPRGLLFLGPSESLGRHADLFDRIDSKWKLFARREPPVGFALAQAGRTFRNQVPLPERRGLVVSPKSDEPAPGQVVNRLLLELVPPSVLVNDRGDIVHVHGKTGRFLEPAAGSPAGANVLQMARPGLELHLSAAIRQASTTGEARRRGIRVQTNGDLVEVELLARKVDAPRSLRGLILVSFEVVPEVAQAAAVRQSGETADQILELQQDLELARESHQAAIEELETTNEELTSTNEELQSTNEELQSANEELETSREEMQSLNEELQTLNSEMQSKLDELSRANDDMQNLLNSTDVAVVFLDRDLNVKRFTFQATKVFNLIPSDIGRPIGDLVSKLQYDRMPDDANEVLRTLVFREIEVQGKDGAWYLMRILPYRTHGDRIGGLVLTLFDTTKIRRLQYLEAGLRNALERLPVTVLCQDRDLRIMWAHAPAFGRDSVSLQGKTERDFLPPEEAEVMSAMKRKVLDSGKPLVAEVGMTVPEVGATVQVLSVDPLRDSRGELNGLVSVMVDVTDRRQHERTTRELRAELDAALAKNGALEKTIADLQRRSADRGRPGS